jgi:O-antigen/teichoic acid export membrane protein
MKEQLGQILVTAVGFLDRLLLAGLLYRFWGAEKFELWSALLAFASFGALFEFGFNLYFNNRITFETEKGDQEAARTTLFEANGIFALAGLTGCAALATIAVHWGVAGTDHSGSLLAATILLSSAATLRLLTTGMNAQYRANRAFSRLSYILAGGELLRIVATAVAVFGGADILAAAVTSFVVQMVMPVLTVILDTKKRFAPHHIGFRLPKGKSLSEAMAMSSAYFGQLFPVILWASAPVLILQGMPLATGILASFVIMRTLANLARTPLQSFGIVIGQECGRRIAVGDLAGALAALGGGARLFAVLGGLACGVVMSGGATIVGLWTGDQSLFTLPLAVAAMLPMLLGAVSILAHNILVASNAPYLALVARWLQLAVTIIAYFVLSPVDAGLRVMLALAAGEILGYLPVAYYAMNRLILGSGFGFHIRAALLTLMSAGVAVLLCKSLLHFANPDSQIQLVGALALAGFGCSIWATIVAIENGTRHRMIDSIRRRVLGARS